jgi:ATP-dependent exoDNAse (exonuclease V) alpha subunit
MRDKGVYNGMRGRLTTAALQSEKAPWIYSASIEFPDEGLKAQGFDMCGAQYNREKTFDDVTNAREETDIDVYSWDGLGALFDFGYAMTCHKAQGSSWPDVLVVSEVGGWCDVDTRTRWLYTAITRASDRLTVLR